MPLYEYKGISGEKNTYADGVIEALNEDESESESEVSSEV